MKLEDRVELFKDFAYAATGLMAIMAVALRRYDRMKSEVKIEKKVQEAIAKHEEESE